MPFVLRPLGIVHLDLKPQNFVFVRGVLKLIDLGISQRLPDDCTRINPTVPLGTLTFMSPEQLGASELSAELSHDPFWNPDTVSETRLTVSCFPFVDFCLYLLSFLLKLIFFIFTCLTKLNIFDCCGIWTGFIRAPNRIVC